MTLTLNVADLAAAPAPAATGVPVTVTVPEPSPALADALSTTSSVEPSGPLNDCGSAGDTVTPLGRPDAANLIAPLERLKRLSSRRTVVFWPATTSTRSASWKPVNCGTTEKSGGGGFAGLS